MKKKKNKVISLASSCILIIVAALLVVYFLSDDTKCEIKPFGDTQPDSVSQSVSQSDVQAETTSSEAVTTEPLTSEETTVAERFNEETGRKIVDPEQELWNLVVVNTSREMPDDYVPELKEVCSSGKYMHELVAPYYNEMYDAAKKDGITLTPYSGYRSYERQKNNYNNLTESYMSQYNLSREEAAKKAATVILPPGTSEHNLGLAMDICNTLDSFADTKEFKWLTENAHRYGFILRYTADKQEITGIVPEPWHWRYVGVEYAEKIKNSGLCLEEYLEREGIAY